MAEKVPSSFDDGGEEVDGGLVIVGGSKCGKDLLLFVPADCSVLQDFPELC